MFQKLFTTNLFVFILTSALSAQVSYFDYLDYTSQWQIKTISVYPDFGCATGFVNETMDSWLYSVGDTLIQGNWYYKIYLHQEKYVTCMGNKTNHSSTALLGFLREDSTKTFYWHNGTAETILWDFNLSIGSIVDANCTVTTINSVSFGTRNLAEFDCGCSNNNLIIEGVGSLSGLFNTYFCGIGIESNSYLVCYKKQNDVLVVNSSFDCSFPIALNTDQLRPKEEALSIHLFPNPVDKAVSVVLNQLSSTGKATIEIGNLLGQIVLSTPTQELNTTLDLSTMPAGVYNLRVSIDQTQITKQIIKY